MRADVTTNLCTNWLIARKNLGGSPPHPHDMAAANRTLSWEKKTTLHQYSWTHSGIMIRSGFAQVATLSVRRVSPYQVSVSSKHNIQLKPCSCRGVAEWGDPRISMLIRVPSSAPTGVQSASDLLQNAFHKTSSVCSWSDSPNVSFPSQHNCHFYQLESSRCRHWSRDVATIALGLRYVWYVRHLVALRWLGLPLHPLDFEVRTVDSITFSYHFDFDS